METTQTTARYTTGQPVEVYAPDFTAPGFPYIWHPATITATTAREDGLLEVMVKADKGTFHPQIVGKRGGNKRLRAA